MKDAFEATTEWTVCARDLFDRESPASVDARGIGLQDGLTELWRRALSEEVRDGGSRSFTSFTLSWAGGHTDVGAQPFDNHELAALRGLVYGTPGPYEPGGVSGRDALLERENLSLLRSIALAHLRLMHPADGDWEGWKPDSPAARIRACAATRADETEIAARLAALRRPSRPG